MNRNDIHYEAYELRSGRITLILRQEEEVWLSDLPPEIARRLQEMQKLSGEGNLSRFINVDPDLLDIEILDEVPPLTVLHSGELAPVRRWIYKISRTLGDASGMSFRITALGFLGVGVVSWIFPPAAPIAVAFGKAALLSASGILASGAVEGGAKQIMRKGYVRFSGKCIKDLPPHKASISEAEFVGIMKRTHYERLKNQIRKLSDGTEPLPQDLQTEKGNYA